MPLDPQTCVYKTVDGCDIRADAYLPPGGAGNGPAPVVVWLHGGALMWGSCTYMTRDEQVALYTRAGYAFVAMDYRLAPETPLPDIVADVCDGLAWVRGEGAARFGFDPARVGVVGHSAGGYLALMSGIAATPPPHAIVSLYGYGDILAPWYTEPSAFHLQGARVPEADARAAVGGPAKSIAGRDRALFYLYCRQTGTWPREVSGFDPAKERGRIEALCPERRATAAYPPTLLLHGDADTDVPHEQSIAMAHALRAAGVANELLILKGYGHVFDDHFDQPDVVRAFDTVLRFLHKHVKNTRA